MGGLNPAPAEDGKINKEKLYDSVFCAEGLKEWWVNDIAGPLERFFIRKRINPDYLTWTGVAISAVGALLFATGHILMGGVLVIVGGCFDFFDGRVARALNRVTASGAFLDSVTDRIVDMLLFCGLIVFFRNSWLVFVVAAGLIGSVMVSYIRAKAESLGLECRMGMMQRPERVAYLGVGSMLSGMLTVSMMPFYSSEPPSHFILGFVLIVVAIMSNVVAFQRLRSCYVQLKVRKVGV